MTQEINRTMKLHFADADTLTSIAEITGNKELFQAIGYLSQWGMGSDRYAFCEIFGGVYDGNPELIATYRAEERGVITYQIGAMWHAAEGGADGSASGHFGFHS